MFLAPRGLVTILLFFAIPEELNPGTKFQGVLLFVILVSCLIMTWSLISYKNKLMEIKDSDEEEGLDSDSEITTTEEINEPEQA